MPRLPPRLHSSLLLPLLAALLAGACTRPPEPLSVWRRHDLASLPTKRDKPVEKVIAYLGAAAARDLPKGLGPQARAEAPAVSAGEIVALEQVVGQTLRYELELGQEAYFSFIPLRTVGWPCRCTYRVTVVPRPGERHPLLEHVAEEMTPPAPAELTIDLSPWSGQRIELLLDLDAPAASPPPRSSRGLWGSPAVWGRFAAPRAPRYGRTTPERPNVLLVGIDTLRADALGAWGRTPSTSPTLDALARESDVYLDAYSTFNVTTPSFISIHTGLYGKHHGSYGLRTPVGADATTLAELFAGAGYDTTAVVSARHLGDHNSGLGQGFASMSLTGGQYAAELAVDTLLDWLAGREAVTAGEGAVDRTAAPPPFFAWLHLFDPHTPHTPPRPYALGYVAKAPIGLAPGVAWTHFREPGPIPYAEPTLLGAIDLYAAEVAYLDRQIDRLLGFLDSRGLLETTVIAVVADHGENLEDHGVRFRHAGLWDTTTHVPLMIRWPQPPAAGAPRGRRFSGLVQTIDLFPTLLRATGIPIPPQDGEDLATLFAAGRSGRRVVFADHSDQLGAMVRTRSHKLITGHDNPLVPDGPYVYDLTTDPGELVNLAGRGLAAEAELARILDAWKRELRHQVRGEGERQLSAEDEKRLQALGYL